MLAYPIAPVRVNPAVLHPLENRTDLGGEWRFRLDPDDQGVQEGWFSDIAALADRIQVPGCWQGQGFGSDANDKVFDFRYHARVFRATYAGTGWYGKFFKAPSQWNDRRVWLNFGGAHPSAEVWLNGVRLGENWRLSFLSALRSPNTSDLMKTTRSPCAYAKTAATWAFPITGRGIGPASIGPWT